MCVYQPLCTSISNSLAPPAHLTYQSTIRHHIHTHIFTCIYTHIHLRYKLYEYSILEWMWKLFFELPYLPWLCIVGFITTWLLNRNTSSTMKQAQVSVCVCVLLSACLSLPYL